jgi:hypothetical protein
MLSAMPQSVVARITSTTMGLLAIVLLAVGLKARPELVWPIVGGFSLGAVAMAGGVLIGLIAIALQRYKAN